MGLSQVDLDSIIRIHSIELVWKTSILPESADFLIFGVYRGKSFSLIVVGDLSGRVRNWYLADIEDCKEFDDLPNLDKHLFKKVLQSGAYAILQIMEG